MVEAETETAKLWTSLRRVHNCGPGRSRGHKQHSNVDFMHANITLTTLYILYTDLDVHCASNKNEY